VPIFHASFALVASGFLFAYAADDLPKGQLAALLGTIPETLSRAFYQLGQEGIIEMNGTTIRLCDRQRLINLEIS
jgi:DNA-binding transcriptional regulator YhcF (GntR family)